MGLGHLSNALVALAVPSHIHVADLIYQAMHGMGTRDGALIRAICSQRQRVLAASCERFVQARGEEVACGALWLTHRGNPSPAAF